MMIEVDHALISGLLSVPGGVACSEWKVAELNTLLWQDTDCAE
jgi:hypothetical protein